MFGSSRPFQHRVYLLRTIVASWLLASLSARAGSLPSPEMTESRQWMAARFEAGPDAKSTQPFFSFTYGAKPSAELLRTWAVTRATRPLDGQRTEHTLTYTDPATGLVVRCVGVASARAAQSARSGGRSTRIAVVDRPRPSGPDQEPLVPGSATVSVGRGRSALARLRNADSAR